mgnify:CR=1 FL=1
MSKAAELAALIGSQSSLSKSNIVINGAMQAWQRGTTSITASGPQYFCDRFATDHGQGGATTSQLTLSGSDTPYTLGFRYGLRMTNTTNTTATNGYRQYRYRLEAQDIANSGWNYTDPNSSITLSFWVRSSLAGTYYCTLEPDDQSDNYAYNIGFTLLANTWTKVTHAVPGHSTLVFNNDNGIGMSIHWRIWLGTNYTTSGTGTSSWYDTDNSGTLSPDFSQNWANTSSATFDLTGFQMELGEVATPFKHETFTENLMRCRRYYQQYDATNAYTRFALGVAYDSSSIAAPLNLPVQMRAAPTFASSGNFDTLPDTVDLDTMSVQHATNEMVEFRGVDSGNGLTANRPYVIRADNDTSAKIQFISEL